MANSHIRLSILLFLCLITGSTYAQSSLSGKVYNKAGNAPIQGALLQIPDLKVSAVSDSAGNYSFNNLPKGTYVVEADALGYASMGKTVKTGNGASLDFPLEISPIEENEVVVTGLSSTRNRQLIPQPVTEITNDYLNEHSATNVIDAISLAPGISAMTDGQSISKPVIRGLGYNRVLTVNDGVEQMDQVWFDEFGIEADPDAVHRVEILKGPASLAYGSDAVAGVVNLIPEAPLAEGQTKGDVLFNYQTNNGLINNMAHVAGTQNGVSWSARVDNIMAHAYQNPSDGYVLNSQFSNFNADGTLGLHRRWGYTQLHASYFDMATGIVDGTRDSAGNLAQVVSYPDLNGGQPTYETPTKQMLTSYTPLVINQRIRHTKVVWDNSLELGEGRLKATFSYQKNQRQETNDPTMPNTPDIYYLSNALTYDLRYISPQIGNFSMSAGVNGAYQDSKSLGTVMLIPDYHFFQGGVFAIGNYNIGKLALTGGVRFDTRSFTGESHWIDTTNVAQAPVPPNTPGSFEEFQQFTTNFSGLSASLGGSFPITNSLYVKANVAKGYRAPNVAECAANGVHDGTVIYEIGDNSIKPESNVEEDLTIGVNAKNVTFEGTVFNNYFSNFIYKKALLTADGQDSLSNLLSVNGSLFPDAPIYVYSQDQAQLYGAEAMLDVHPSAAPWLELNTTFSYVDGGLVNAPDSTKYIPFVPPARLTADLIFHFKKAGKGIRNAYVRAGVVNVWQQNHVYLGEAAATGLNTAPGSPEYIASQSATAGYTFFNAGLGGDIQSNGRTVCKLYVYASNLFDTPYMDYMSRFKYLPYNPANGRVGVLNMGRNISVKAIIPFDFTRKK